MITVAVQELSAWSQGLARSFAAGSIDASPIMDLENGCCFLWISLERLFHKIIDI